MGGLLLPQPSSKKKKGLDVVREKIMRQISMCDKYSTIAAYIYLTINFFYYSFHSWVLVCKVKTFFWFSVNVYQIYFPSLLYLQTFCIKDWECSSYSNDIPFSWTLILIVSVKRGRFCHWSIHELLSYLPWNNKSSCSSYTQEEDRRIFSAAQALKARPSSVFHELDMRKLENLRIGDSVLGQVSELG